MLRAATLAFTLLASAGLAQDTKLLLPPAPLLPASFGAWQATESASSTAAAPVGAGSTPATPSLAANLQVAAALKEDGLSREAQRTYSGSGGATLTIKAWQFDDATGSFAAYSAMHAAAMQPLEGAQKIGKTSARAGSTWLLRDGVTVVAVTASAPSAHLDPDLRRLVAMLPKIGGNRGLEPALPTYIPTAHLVPGSIRYALGPAGYTAEGGMLPADVIEFGKSAEVLTARYREGGKDGLLTLFLYPTPTIAGDRGRAITAALNSAGITASNAKIRREGPLVILATGLPPETAQTMVDNIHLHNEVTWSQPVQPEFHAEVRKTASLLASIGTFCGLGALTAIVLGLFFGGGRAAIRVLQGKPAHSEPEFLRLGLREGPSAPLSMSPLPQRVDRLRPPPV
jgi:hypothetical protein